MHDRHWVLGMGYPVLTMDNSLLSTLQLPNTKYPISNT